MNSLNALFPAAGASSGSFGALQFAKGLLVPIIFMMASFAAKKWLPKMTNDFSRYISRLALSSFLMGGLICIFLASGPDGSLTRELTRFLQVGIFLSAIVGAHLTYTLWTRSIKDNIRYLLIPSFILTVVTVLSTISTIDETSRWLTTNLKTQVTPNFYGCTNPKDLPTGVLSISQRITFLLSENKIQSGGTC